MTTPGANIILDMNDRLKIFLFSSCLFEICLDLLVVDTEVYYPC
jgi:hypothetical protein